MDIPRTLIDPQTLAGLEPNAALIVDCRFDLADPEAGERAYVAGHVPGAVYAHLDRDLSDLSQKSRGLGRHPLPDARAFVGTLARWGWRPGLPVVAYDAHAGAIGAARLWWMLRLLGQPAAVLDGGWRAWVDAGLPQQRESPRHPVPDPSALAYANHFNAAAMVDTVDMERLVRDRTALIVDARSPERYRGEVEPIDPQAGHMPGAINRPFSGNLDTEGRFKLAATLRAEWQALLAGVDPSRVVHSCGSGVSACHNLLAMEHAGLGGSRLYPPSWSGWVSQPDRPIERS